jgi:hypothetical protein
MRWICKRTCAWRDTIWMEGEFIEILGVKKWTYSNGFWHPEGVAKPMQHQLIPRHFEPERLSFVKRADLLLARAGTQVEAKFTVAVNLDEKPTPEMVLDEQLAIEREKSNLPDSGD